jgi:hypothetical protein
MLALRLGDIARVEIAKLLGSSGRERHHGRGKQQDALWHQHPPLRAHNQARRI